MPSVQKIPCTVSELTDHGEHVYTLTLAPERSVPRFTPGQFLHLTIDPYDPSTFWPESRVFSIASSPKDRQHLKITYSVRGEYTRRMEQELRRGAVVWVKLPYGEFTIDPTRPAVLLAGGTGVTAYTAFLENLPPEPQQPVFLAYGARTPELLIYRSAVEHVARRTRGVQVYLFAEESSRDTQTSGLPPLFPGRINLEELWVDVQPYSAGALFYLSGPPAMIQGLTSALQARCIPADQIRVDAWE